MHISYILVGYIVFFDWLKSEIKFKELSIYKVQCCVIAKYRNTIPA